MIWKFWPGVKCGVSCERKPSICIKVLAGLQRVGRMRGRNQRARMSLSEQKERAPGGEGLACTLPGGRASAACMQRGWRHLCAGTGLRVRSRKGSRRGPSSVGCNAGAHPPRHGNILLPQTSIGLHLGLLRYNGHVPTKPQSNEDKR